MSEEQRPQCAPRTRTLADLAREAIDIQNACNPLGITKGFAEATQELADLMRNSGEYPFSTHAVCLHPVFQLWASKLHDLAGIGMSDTEKYGEAYAECKKLAEAGERPCVGCGDKAVASCPECATEHAAERLLRVATSRASAGNAFINVSSAQSPKLRPLNGSEK